MKITVLGAMNLTENGPSYLPTAPKERQLTALLLINANRMVSISTCLAELWADVPPRTARGTLQTYVMHLRRTLAAVPSVGSMAGAHALLPRSGRGYCLRVPPGQLDIEEFQRHIAGGAAAAEAGDDATASRQWRAGLAIWRGSPLADVVLGRVLEAEVTQLEHVRMSVREQCIAAELRLGRHGELLGELTALVRRHPLNETLHRQYMLALYRCGRQVEALTAFHALTRRLRVDLGVDVGAETRAVQQAILSGDPALEPLPGARVLSRA